MEYDKMKMVKFITKDYPIESIERYDEVHSKGYKVFFKPEFGKGSLPHSFTLIEIDFTKEIYEAFVRDLDLDVAYKRYQEVMGKDELNSVFGGNSK